MDQQPSATAGAERTPITVVREIYEAFAAKDIEAILALTHPEIVVLQDPALPWGGRHEGHDGLGTFMLALVGAIDSAVTIEEMFQAGDTVVQHGRTAGTVRASGVAFDIRECHVWRVVDGLAVEARYFIDSAAMLEALSATATEPDAPPAHEPMEVPARSVPVPTSVSPEAQAVLGAMGLFAAAAGAASPSLDDADGWRAIAATGDELMLSFANPKADAVAATVEDREVDGVTIYVITPDDLPAEAADRVCLEIHGGALIMGGGAACRAMNTIMAGRVGVATWGVDYRMPPDHPYPAALDDCLAAYRALLREHRPEDIVITGSSAGGNLALAVLLRARDQGLPMPAALVLLTPECDLTESGDTFSTNLGVDTVLTARLMPMNLLYAGGHDLHDPYLSPLFGDFSNGFPPTFLQTGTRDLFLSNTVRLHRKLRAAGVEVELHVFEAMPHGGFFGAPEDDELDAEVRRFIDARWRPAGV